MYISSQYIQRTDTRVIRSVWVAEGVVVALADTCALLLGTTLAGTRLTFLSAAH